jgi:hypothetical protein
MVCPGPSWRATHRGSDVDPGRAADEQSLPAQQVIDHGQRIPVVDLASSMGVSSRLAVMRLEPMLR